MTLTFDERIDPKSELTEMTLKFSLNSRAVTIDSRCVELILTCLVS
jgi:hypothetical protein